MNNIESLPRHFFKDSISLSGHASTRGHSLELVVPFARTNMQNHFLVQDNTGVGGNPYHKKISLPSPLSILFDSHPH